MNIIPTLTCKYCNKIFKYPITLNCCGKNICKKDIDESLSNGNNKCPFCDHEIPNQTFSINETLQVIIEQMELPEVRINPEYEKLFKDFKEKIELVENMSKNAENTVHEKFSELRRLVDLDRENAKQEIDRIAACQIKELDEFENQFRSTCKSKVYLDYYDRLIQVLNVKLNEYEKCLNSLRRTDADRTRASNAIKNVLDREIKDFENELFKYKSIEYEPMGNISSLGNDFGKLLVKEKEKDLKFYIGNEGFIASNGRDGKIDIWDVKDWKSVKKLGGHTHNVRSLIYIKEMSYLVSGDEKGTINIWNVKEGKLFKTLPWHGNTASVLTYIKEMGCLASSGDDKVIYIWDLKEGELIKKLEGHSALVSALTYIKEMDYLVSGDENGTINIWDVKEGKLIRTFKMHTKNVLAMAYIKQIGYLASSHNSDSGINIWDVKEGKLIKTLKGSNSRALAYVEEKGFLASVSYYTINLWDVKEGQLIRTLEGSSCRAYTLTYIKEMDYLVSDVGNSKINIWELKEGKLIKTLQGESPVVALAYIKE